MIMYENTVMATPELSEAWELSLRWLHYLRLPDRARLARAMKSPEFGHVYANFGWSWGMSMFIFPRKSARAGLGTADTA
jgi:hypothetical protein